MLLNIKGPSVQVGNKGQTHIAYPPSKCSSWVQGSATYCIRTHGIPSQSHGYGRCNSIVHATVSKISACEAQEKKTICQITVNKNTTLTISISIIKDDKRDSQ